MKFTKLFAVLLSDGSVDKKRYTVSFTESDQVVKKLVNEFEKIKDIEIKWKLDKHLNSLRARAYSKNLVHLLFSFSPSFRSRQYNVHPKNPWNSEKNEYPKTKIPEHCFSSKKKIRTFLKYYSTCDGGPEFSIYQRKDRNIFQLHMGIKIGCKNLNIKNGIYNMLKTLGINATKKSDGIVIRKMTEIKKFHIYVGFMNESKVRRAKLFNGYKKNEVVTLMIFCSGLTKKYKWINKNFQNIAELEKFLIDCIKNINNKNKLNEIIDQKLNQIVSVPSRS